MRTWIMQQKKKAAMANLPETAISAALVKAASPAKAKKPAKAKAATKRSAKA